MEPQSLRLTERIDTKQDDYPITLEVRRNTHKQDSMGRSSSFTNGSCENGSYQKDQSTRLGAIETGQAVNPEIEIIKAKYLIGCDGARSWTRAQLRISLEGETTEHIWGVMDIVPMTNFRMLTVFLSV